MKFSSKKIRNDFIDFFKDKNHEFIRSSSVLPIDDPTLLFTNAGMNQFKKIFLDKEKSKFTRAVNSQKCIRVSGKHNDLEEVGVDKFHHTFFEMLGNWSFGDYYKKDAIVWSWELLTNVWKLDKDRLWVTIYKDDDESEDLWKRYTDVKPDRILRFGNKDNFWEMGETGPCGPCSEIHYYIGNIDKQKSSGVNVSPDYRELWNLVFIEYNRNSNGKLEKLVSKHVDTGMGLERIVATLNNIDDHYLTDLFYPIIEQIIALSGKEYTFEDGIPHRVIADHLRMVAFSISDGIMPSNEGRGYVVRRVLRRACRFGRVLGIEEEFLFKLVVPLIDILGDAYSELIDKKDHVVKVIKSEETSFGKTLDRGLLLFEEISSNIKSDKISGKDVFKLYDTYGFPVDLTELLAKEKNISIDKKEFDQLMDKQKTIARNSNKFKIDEDSSSWIVYDENIQNSEFLGYNSIALNANIVKYRRTQNKDYELILDKTPFYAESGGQIGDSGTIKNDKFTFDVKDTYFLGKQICHRGEILNGDISKSENIAVKAMIDEDKRKSIKSNHTATHLLHKALKIVLGTEVQQAGSLVSNDYLRFDLTYYKKINKDQINEIENIINNIIRSNIDLETSIKNFDEAKKDGAEALFGEKYGDKVRVVNIDGFSKELCGGTHVSSTGNIGLFKIISESSLASGVRRIEAFTGEKALTFMKHRIEIIEDVKSILMCNEEDIINKINSINLLNKSYKKQISELNMIKANTYFSEYIDKKLVNVSDVKLYVDSIDLDLSPQLLSDIIREKLLVRGIGLLGIKSGDKNLVLCLITKDFNDSIHAGDFIKEIANKIGVGGGGSQFMAIMKVGDNIVLDEVLDIGTKIIKNKIK